MIGRRLRLKIRHAEPCTQSWDAMRGNMKSRHCEACDKQVHNFAGMTASEIRKLLVEKEGRLCARIVRNADGSIETRDQQSKQGMAAGFVLAASLAAGTAAAQTLDSPTMARLSGTVLSPDGSTPMKGILVALIAGEKTAATGQTDQAGNFTLLVEPGKYDVVISRNVFQKSRIPNTELHQGDQIIPPLRFGFDQQTIFETVTMGIVVSTYRYPASYFFKHPLRYLKNIRHQL
jgi:hypothetical protein